MDGSDEAESEFVASQGDKLVEEGSSEVLDMEKAKEQEASGSARCLRFSFPLISTSRVRQKDGSPTYIPLSTDKRADKHIGCDGESSCEDVELVLLLLVPFGRLHLLLGAQLHFHGLECTSEARRRSRDSSDESDDVSPDLRRSTSDRREGKERRRRRGSWWRRGRRLVEGEVVKRAAEATEDENEAPVLPNYEGKVRRNIRNHREKRRETMVVRS